MLPQDLALCGDELDVGRLQDPRLGTVLLLCAAPKLVPLMVTMELMRPAIGEIEVMAAAGVTVNGTELLVMP